MLKNGRKAPVFELPDADMETFSLASALRHGPVVVFFYPKDDTPGCTLQATDFSDHDEEFLACSCQVVGISRDDCLSHAAFRDKHGIGIRLLADTETAVCRQYGVWQPKEVDGVRREGIVRSTFIIDQSGVIRHALYGVTPRGHVQEVLRLVKELKQ